MSYKLTRVTLIVMMLYAAGARAADADAPMFRFDGFGTLGIVHSSEDKADFVADIFRPDGAGHSHNWSGDIDSRIGAQVTASLTPQLSAVLQVVAKQRYDDTYMPTVEWANFKYQFTPDFSVRIGRIVLPIFLVTDTYNVSYSYPWVRPPIEMYRLVPVTNQDGLDARYRLRFGDWTHVMQANMGWNDTRQPHDLGSAKARRTWSIIDTAEYGALTLHASYAESHLTITALNPLFGAFRNFGAQGNAIADRYDPLNKLDRTVSVGASYDPGDWFLMGEWGTFDAHSVIVRSSGWYLSGGYRIGNFTPYLTYARIKADGNTSDPGLDVTTLPPFLVGPASGLNAALNGILGASPVQHSVSVGSRWDFMKNTALKMQYDHTSLGAGSPGLLLYLQPGFQPGGKFNLFSAAVDFVF